MKNLTDAVVKNLLQQCFLFSPLTDEEIDNIIVFAKYKVTDKNNVIFLKAGQAEQMFVILEGAVRITTSSEDGREITLDMLGPTDIFGEISIFDGGTRTANAIATAKSQFLVINRRDLISFLETHPMVTLKFLAGLSAKLRSTDDFLEDILFRKLSVRLARKLLSLAGSQGETFAEESVKITEKFSHQDLGHRLNATRESICRQMRLWEMSDQVSMDEGHIIINNIVEFEFENADG